RGRRLGLPGGARRVYLAHAAACGPDQLQAAGGRGRVVSRGLGAAGDSFGGYRARLAETLRVAGIRDLAVLRAVAETPRHLFVPEAVRHRAYEDVALPIGAGQTISRPFTQARYLVARTAGELRHTPLGDARFVPLVGEHGFDA